jgi:uncharacterized protein Veg
MGWIRKKLGELKCFIGCHVEGEYVRESNFFRRKTYHRCTRCKAVYCSSAIWPSKPLGG